ncbi:MAG TPA: hypothetical protein VM686_01295 [Polyangiaceae bacterium]|nr:hypothetical protein [Polyangiaceae bacterium]
MSGDATDEPPDLFSTSRRLWSSWLADLSLIMDITLRSPAFLGWMKYGLKAMSETRRYHAGGLVRSLDEREQGSSPTWTNSSH